MNRASRYLANVLALVRVVIVGVIVCICHHATPSAGKIFERCELAQLLRYGHGLDVNDVANWVCIAQHSSSLNSSAFGGDARSGSHGLFQISDQYWCSPPGKGIACGVTCDRLRDDDISDDLDCIRVIYEEHQRLSGDGYNAWNAYQPYCRENPYEYVEDCFGNEEREYLHSKSITANYVEDEEEEENDFEPYATKKRSKVYGRCELAKELFLKHKMPMEEIPTWVCIAQHESNYDTSAVGRLNTDGSADHGLFQISDLYWCSHKGGRRKACGLPCSKLLDSDITDDVKCVKQIYKEHTKISGDGFTAWTVYNAYCHGKTEAYIRGCFDGIDAEETRASEEYRKPPKPSRVEKNQKPHGKVYEPCELAEELRSKHNLPEDQIATWVCIAKHESEYNTSAIGYGDHGLFQISDIYWCSPPGKGWACGLSCADLEDSDITDDVECIRKIYAEHTHLSGDGFNAWTVYPRFCSEGRSEKYISHCPGSNPQPAVTAPPHGYSKLANLNSIEDDDYDPGTGKIYGRCELAKELLTKFDMSMDEIPTWVCIAHHESNYDTSAVGRLNTDGSADHGLFQISDLYWCSHKGGHGKACGLPCTKLLDNDISDDVRCIKQIYNEHTRISGDGFTAWTVYNAYCRERTEQYIRGCFDGTASEEHFKPRQRPEIDYGFEPKNKPKGKVYEECELAAELRDIYHIPSEQISTWVCIAKHQSGLNTSSSVSDVHGMFHISDEYWCSPPGKGKVCELACSDLEDSDISDDVECIQKIYLEHQRLFGNGFSAWVVYAQHCSVGRSDAYVGHCPGFESTMTNAIAYGTPKLFNAVNRPVYNHELSENPFLRHVEVVNSDAASTFFSYPIEESLSASDEVDTIVPEKHEFSLNPFLKHVKPIQAEAPVETTTAPSAFFGIPIAPTPTKTTRLQTYQPQNEEQAKYEAFKAFATPSLPLTTQTPRANRLQTYQLNTFKTTVTPSLPTVTNRLQPYQLNTFSSFKSTATPTTQLLSTRTALPTVPPRTTTKPYTFSTFSTTVRPTTKPSLKPLPTAPPKPFTTTRSPLTQISKGSGRYDSGRYDSGRYDAGRYDPGRYSQPSKTTLNINSQRGTKSNQFSSGQYPTPTLQNKPPTSIKIASTSLSSSKPFGTSSQKTAQQSFNRFPTTSTNSGRYEPFKTIATATATTKPPARKFDPFKAFLTTTVKPSSTTVTNSKKFEAFKAENSGKYIPHKPSSTSKDSGKYIPTNFGVRTSATTRSPNKFDPFKPIASSSGSYDPFKVFNTGQKPSSTASLFSSATSSNELDFSSSANSKRDTDTVSSQTSTGQSLTGTIRTSQTNKRETKSEQKPSVITSAQEQKSAISSTPIGSGVLSSTTGSVSTIEEENPTGTITSKTEVPVGSVSSSPTRSVTKPVIVTSKTGIPPRLVGSSSTRSVNNPTIVKPETEIPARSVSTTPITSVSKTSTVTSNTENPTRSVTKTPTVTSRTTTPARSVSSSPTRSASKTATATSKTATPTRSVSSSPTRSTSKTATVISKTATPTRSVSSTPTRSVSKTATVTSKTATPTRTATTNKLVSPTPTIASKSVTASRSSPRKSSEPTNQPTIAAKQETPPGSAVTTNSSLSASSQLSATPTSSSERSSRSVTSSGTNRLADTLKPTLNASRQFKATTPRSVASSSKTRSITTPASGKPTSIVISKSITSTNRQHSVTPTKSFVSSPVASSSINTSPTAKHAAIVTSKPTSTHRQYSATPTKSVTPTRSSTTSSLPTIKTTVTSVTRPKAQKSLNPSKVIVTSTRSPTRPTRPLISSSLINPTKSHRSSESLYSKNLNIFDLYYKLYGVYPAHRTSPGVDQATKTSQAVPSRTS